MIKVNIIREDTEAAEKLRYSHPNLQVRRRMSIIFLKGISRTHQEIAELAGVSSTTVTTVLRLYQGGGLKAVEDVTHRKPVSSLEQHSEMILNHFKTHPPSTANEAKAEIYKLTKIERNVSRIKVFLHKLGLKPRKTAGLPAKVDPAAQELFKKKCWSLG